MTLSKLKLALTKAIWIIPTLFLLGTLASYVGGCAGTPNRVAYRVESSSRVGAQVALSFWNDQFVKPGRATIAQEVAVRSAYEKLRASEIAVCDAGKLLAAASSDTNAYQAAFSTFEQALQDASNDKGDMFNLLSQFGVKNLK